VGEGGSNEHSEFETGEGYGLSIERDPSSAFDASHLRHLLPQGGLCANMEA
jgi:hypothetical protein